MSDNTGHSFVAYFKRAVSPLVVLALLREKPMYGYEISKLMKECSNGKLKVAVLYPVLYRLEEEGYVYISDTTVENGRARNYYAITPEGREYVARTAAEFGELSDIFLRIMKRQGGEADE